MHPSRRDTLTILLATALMAHLPAAEAAPRPGSTFDAADLLVLRAVLEVVYGPGHEDTDALTAVAESLAYLAPDRQALFVALPQILDLGTRVLLPTYRALPDLGLAEREAALEAWAASSWETRRAIYGALRLLLLFHAHTDPRTWPLVGYPGPLIGRVALPVHALRYGEP